MSAAADHVSAAVAPFVMSMHAYDLGPGGVHRGLPSSAVTVTIPEQDPLEIGWVGRRGPGERLRAVVAGLHLDAAELRQPGCTRGVYLTLSPLGARALLGVPAAALAGHAADLTDLVPAMAELPERLADCRSWPQRRALLERVLLAGLERHGERADRRPLGAALSALSANDRVQDAARTLGCSRRYLSGAVRSEFGVTPKQYQRLVRFERARGRVVAASLAGRLDLAAIANTSGFADQAHLAREWRAMAGCTLTEWLRTEGPTPPPRPTSHARP